MKSPEPETPDGLPERVDDALKAFWQGDSSEFERLLNSEDATGTPVGELLEGIISEHAKPVSGWPRGCEVPGYEIIGEIGRGGMGAVYRALQVSTKRVVALKVMLAGPFASEAGRRRFQREVELTARFQHPGIVRVLEGGATSTGQPYYTMDYVPGIPLNEWLAAESRSVSATLSLFGDLGEAVEYAHRHGVVHRDLKPGNVLVDDEDKPHVLDFGLAKAVDHAETAASVTTEVSLAGQVMGTPRYLAPEQAAGASDQVDARTDVYALGVMLFEALTGALPYDQTGRPSDVVRRIMEEPPVRPSSVSRRVDNELEAILLKTLEKDPARRYQSAQGLSEDLRRYLEGEPIVAKRPSTLYVLRKKVARHRGRLLLTVALLITGVGALAGVVLMRHQRLARGRWYVLACQRDLETQVSDERLASAYVAYTRYENLPEARLMWAQTQFRVGLETAKEDWFEESIRTLKKGLENGASAWLFRALLAEILRRRQDPEWEQWQAGADRDAPDTGEGWYLRTYATLEIEKAKRYAEKALERAPGHALARRRLADLYLRLGEYDKALRMAQDAERQGAEPHDWKMFQGYVLMKRGDYAEAITVFTQVIGVDPESSVAHQDRALAYLCLDEYEKAIDDYSISVHLRRSGTYVGWGRYHRATPLWMVGRRKEAAEDYREFRALRKRVSYADARLFFVLHEEARAPDAQGRPSEAAQLRREARSVLEAARRGAVSGGWEDRILACLAGELSPVELVAAADPQNPEHVCESYYYAGEVCLLRGQLDEARKWFRKCVDTRLLFDPSSPYPVVMNEYHLAKWRLASLSPPGPGASPPDQSKPPDSEPSPCESR